MRDRLQYLLDAVAERSDERAFDELFRMCYPHLLSYTMSLLKSRPAAEEICIDVLLRVWRNRKILPTIKNFSHYIHIAAKHAVISYTRSKEYKQLQKKISLEDAGEYFESELNNQELRLVHEEKMELVNAALNRLPSKCRLIFKLVKEDGLKYAEVAQLLELSVNTVENQMVIAMKKLVVILCDFRATQKKIV